MRRLPLILLALVTLAPAARGLSADNLLLIVNSNVPEGRALAEFYAGQRKVPDKRILELALPSGEEMSFADYETLVVPPVRDYIARNKLADKVTCLVTFYGVPLKVAGRVNTPGDKVELAAVQKEFEATMTAVNAAVGAVEAIAAEVDPTYMPSPDKSLRLVVAREHSARETIARHAARMKKDPEKVQALGARLEAAVAPLLGAAAPLEARFRQLIPIANEWTPEQKKEAEELRDKIAAMRAKFDALRDRRADPDARSQLRQMVKEQLGPLEYARLLEGMIEYFNADNTDAALDSELAALNWGYYPRANSMVNPMMFKVASTELPPVLMTMRLDGPRPQVVHDLIAASVKAEADGLAGKVVVDAGGHLAIDSKHPNYAAFDQTLHNLADFVRTKTNLTLVFDEKREVLPARSVQDVALYTGWYALVNYTPACTFNPGAVGYHIASFEMTTLRQENNRGWVRGLLNDGIAATLGAVNEPFLHAFPPPDEFFPLLMTGKLTLAEVYWKTNPLVSWRIAMIGDPLYTPYKAKPAVAPEALPEALQAALKGVP